MSEIKDRLSSAVGVDLDFSAVSNVEEDRLQEWHLPSLLSKLALRQVEWRSHMDMLAEVRSPSIVWSEGTPVLD